MAEYSMEILLLVFLAVMSKEDWKEKQIKVSIVAAAALIGIVLQICSNKTGWQDIAAGIGVGGVILVLSRLTNESIGTGDGMMLMVSGIFLGFWKNLSLFLAAQLLIGAAALFLIAVKKKGKTYRLPFAPFLLAAYLFQLL